MGILALAPRRQGSGWYRVAPVCSPARGADKQGRPQPEALLSHPKGGAAGCSRPAPGVQRPSD